MIATDAPDLSGGIHFSNTDRHRAYVDIRAFRKYLTRVCKRMGWADLGPGMFEAVQR